MFAYWFIIIFSTNILCSSGFNHEPLPYSRYFYSPLEFYNPNLTRYLNQLSYKNFRLTSLSTEPRLYQVPSAACVSVVSVSAFDEVNCDHLPPSCGIVHKHIVIHKGIPFIRKEVVLCVALSLSQTFESSLLNASFGNFPANPGQVQLPVPIENFLKFPGKAHGDHGLIFVHSLDATNLFKHILLRPHPTQQGSYIVIPKLCYETHPTIDEFKASFNFNNTHFCYIMPNFNVSRSCSLSYLERLFGPVSLNQLTKFVMDNNVIFTQDDVGFIPMDGYSFSTDAKYVKIQRPIFAITLDTFLSQDDPPTIKYYTVFKTESGYYLHYITDKPYGITGDVNLTCHTITTIHTTYATILIRRASKELEFVLKSAFQHVINVLFLTVRTILLELLSFLRILFDNFFSILKDVIIALDLSLLTLIIIISIVLLRQKMRDWFQVALLGLIFMSFYVLYL